MTRCTCSHLQDNHAIPNEEGNRYCLVDKCGCLDYEHKEVTDVYSVLLNSMTAIRAEESVETLQRLSTLVGVDTPVSGDALARRKSDLAKARR